MTIREIQLPVLTAERAIELARLHIDVNGVDRSEHVLTRAMWSWAASGDEHCWHLEWMTEAQFKEREANPRMRGGGHLLVQVFDESRVQHSFAR